MTLRWLAERMPHERGWFYHFVNLSTGAREWQSELSSIDTALLLAGVLTVRQCFASDPDVVRHADAVYRRVDFRWMLAGHPTTLSHGWKPESGFLPARWDRYCELMILYVLAIGSPTHAIPPESWHAWSRPIMKFQQFTYVGWSDPLFVHQFSHAWVDFRGRREKRSGLDWFENSVTATRAHKAFCLSLSSEFPGYADGIWGITASDSRKGYVAWGGPPRHPAIRFGRACGGGRLSDVRTRHHRAGSSGNAPALRRPHLRALRVRGRVSPDRRLGQPRCDRDRPRHHAAERGKSAVRTGLGMVHAEP